MKEIVQDGNPVLREKAQEVPIKEIGGDSIQSLLKDMHEALEEKEYGVALAAPQISVSKRVFVVAEKVFRNRSKDQEGIKPKNEKKKGSYKLVYINPKIIKTSKKANDLEEACLSVDGYSGTVKRTDKVTIEAYDENGTKFTKGTSGLLSQIFQHEIDHLNGVLYIDHARDIQEVVISEETQEET